MNNLVKNEFYYCSNTSTYNQSVIVRLIDPKPDQKNRVKIEFVYPNVIVKDWFKKDQRTSKNSLIKRSCMVNKEEYLNWKELISDKNCDPKIIYNYLEGKGAYNKNYLDFIEHIHFQQFEQAKTQNKKYSCFVEIKKPEKISISNYETHIWTISEMYSGIVIDTCNRYYLIYKKIKDSKIDLFTKLSGGLNEIIKSSNEKSFDLVVDYTISDTIYEGKQVVFVKNIRKKKFYHF